MSSNSNESENNKLEYSLKDKERIKIMADFEELSFSYLGLLSYAHHDGLTQQIDDACANFETENETFLRKASALHQHNQRDRFLIEKIRFRTISNKAITLLD